MMLKIQRLCFIISASLLIEAHSVTWETDSMLVAQKASVEVSEEIDELSQPLKQVMSRLQQEGSAILTSLQAEGLTASLDEASRQFLQGLVQAKKEIIKLKSIMLAKYSFDPVWVSFLALDAAPREALDLVIQQNVPVSCIPDQDINGKKVACKIDSYIGTLYELHTNFHIKYLQMRLRLAHLPVGRVERELRNLVYFIILTVNQLYIELRSGLSLFTGSYYGVISDLP